MGMARLGDKKSPMLRGGGVAFGPHPRDFSTELPKKIYDLAWRTALSYRYSRGELVVIADGTELEQAEPRWLKQIMDRLHIGAHNGRSTIVTTDHRPNLFTAFDGLSAYGKVKTQDKVDVKNLLETGRIIIEKSALDWIFKAHRSHVKKSVAKAL
jgi:large subunit ribosomal protein L4